MLYRPVEIQTVKRPLKPLVPLWLSPDPGCSTSVIPDWCRRLVGRCAGGFVWFILCFPAHVIAYCFLSATKFGQRRFLLAQKIRILIATVTQQHEGVSFDQWEANCRKVETNFQIYGTKFVPHQFNKDVSYNVQIQDDSFFPQLLFTLWHNQQCSATKAAATVLLLYFYGN